MRTWIFQGNPKHFDIDDYVARYPQLIYWRTPKLSSSIRVGDRVFLWRSGPESGAIAVGRVVEAPTLAAEVEHPEALGDDLWRAKPPSDTELKTGIRILDCRLSSDEGYVPRSKVLADPALASASIITMPNATVFSMTEDQEAAFLRLWGADTNDGTDADDSPSVAEGKRKIAAHYRRERSRRLRQQKLDEAVRERGFLKCELCQLQSTSYPARLGERVFEIHHRRPLATAEAPVRTTLADLALLCASCHRAVHADSAVDENWLTLEQHARTT